MNRATFGELAWQAIDRAIVVGLRRLRRPVPVPDIGEVCRVSRICTEKQLRESLTRLERQGLIRSRLLEVRDEQAPLLGSAIFDAYEATGVDNV